MFLIGMSWGCCSFLQGSAQCLTHGMKGTEHPALTAGKCCFHDAPALAAKRESHITLMMHGEEGIAGLSPTQKRCLFIFSLPQTLVHDTTAI